MIFSVLLVIGRIVVRDAICDLGCGISWIRLRGEEVLELCL